jgi:carbohydrate diacid regulator
MFRKLKDDEIETLIAFANNNMSASQTAKQSFLHRNTVIYRLEKIERITGLSPFNFYQLFQLLQLVGIVTIKCDYFKKGVGENNA